MKTTKFTREVKSLIYLIRQYGIDHAGEDVDSQEKFDNFIFYVHKGFSIAQNRIVFLLDKILNDLRNAKKELKTERNQKDQNKITQALNRVEKLKFQEAVMRKLADGIAWTLFKQDITVARRLYHGHPWIDITSSNMKSCKRAAKDITEKHPCNFVLYNDITSFIQVSDLTIYDHERKRLTFAEVKEGPINKKIADVMQNFNENQCYRYLEYTLDSEGESFAKQFLRVAKQAEVTNNVKNTIVTGVGQDVFTGLPVHIPPQVIEVTTFESQIIKLLEDLKKKNYAIAVIDECLLIGAYNNKHFPSSVFDYWAKEEKIKTPVFDLQQSLFAPVTNPFFLFPFSDNDLIALMLGEKTIKMTIDIDKWLEQHSSKTFSYRWMTKRETSRYNTSVPKAQKIFEVDGRGIELSFEKGKVFLAGGAILRIFTSFIRPQSFVQMLETGERIIDDISNQHDENMVDDNDVDEK